MAEIIFYIIIGIFIFNFALETILELLNLNHLKTKLPSELTDVYNEEKYKKSQQYEKETTRFGLLTGTISFVVILCVLFFDVFEWVDNYTRSFTEHPIGIALLFFGILFIVSDIFNLPFSLYRTFIIEEKYGFNKTTLKTFFFDKLKGLLLGVVIGGGLMALIIWFYMQTVETFWLWAWGIVTAFSLFINMFYSILIVPLFNKQEPLEDGELRQNIELFCQKADFKLDNVFKIDGSKRSTKANAYFSGIGHKKRIVLYDTLINQMTNNELVAVLAHEIGHFKKRHIIWSLIIGIVQTGITFYLLSLFIDNPLLSEAIGVSQHSFHIGLITFGILYSPISTILGLGMNILSRKNEYEADNFAQKYNYANDLINALKKLSVNNLSNLTPHPAYVFVHYSHPPLLERLKMLKSKYTKPLSN